MAFTEKQKQILATYISEMGQGQGSTLFAFVISFIEKSKAEQKADILAWLNAKRAKLLADKESLPVAIAQQQATIDAGVADIDDLKGAL